MICGSFCNISWKRTEQQRDRTASKLLKTLLRKFLPAIIRSVSETTEKTTLANFREALNKMAVALEASFEDFKKREWLKNGLAELNEKMIGMKRFNDAVQQS